MTGIKLPTPDDIRLAKQIVYESMQASPQISWPLLNQRTGADIWVKHENHNPTGAFKVRGGLIYVKKLVDELPDITGLAAATRGNHGQSVAFAAAKYGLTATIVVPEGNSPDKNAAMQAFGAELIVKGQDFDESLVYCRELAEERGLHFMPSIDSGLIPGVATYAHELFSAAPDLDRVYVPIGLGSGICGVIAAKAALGLSVEIIGVVSSHANAYQLSFEAGKPIGTNSADTMADGLAVRNPAPDALDLIRAEVSHVVAVTDEEVMRAIRILFEDTHNVAEGAGAASLAAALAEDNAGKKVGVILTGGNINEALFRQALTTA